MLAETITKPEEYLLYSKKILIKAKITGSYPKIFEYYCELCEQFKAIFYDDDNLFLKMGKLLSIDAEIQMILEIVEFSRSELLKDFKMNEDKIIKIIKFDKKYFYRELTGYTVKDDPRWSLIYLSEN
ncbi:hypothetical protein IGI78_000535 [Enterococcus sp. DIV1767]|uniref:DUF7006 family protein n=1 Tax=Enterococcus sp. DIV1767 TaxID=2774670 RepID=UPI003D2FFC5F